MAQRPSTATLAFLATVANSLENTLPLANLIRKEDVDETTPAPTLLKSLQS
jgi:hypothetical protein